MTIMTLTTMTTIHYFPILPPTVADIPTNTATNTTTAATAMAMKGAMGVFRVDKTGAEEIVGAEMIRSKEGVGVDMVCAAEVFAVGII